MIRIDKRADCKKCVCEMGKPLDKCRSCRYAPLALRYYGFSIRATASMLGISKGTVKYTRSEKAQARDPYWVADHAFSAKDDDTIRALYGKVSAGRIGEEIGRTASSVYNRAYRLGVRAADNA